MHLLTLMTLHFLFAYFISKVFITLLQFFQCSSSTEVSFAISNSVYITNLTFFFFLNSVIKMINLNSLCGF